VRHRIDGVFRRPFHFPDRLRCLRNDPAALIVPAVLGNIPPPPPVLQCRLLPLRAEKSDLRGRHVPPPAGRIDQTSRLQNFCHGYRLLLRFFGFGLRLPPTKNPLGAE
jgi:hypothetical protein